MAAPDRLSAAPGSGEPRPASPSSSPGGGGRRGSWKTATLVLLVVLAGLALRTAQYVGQVDMWYDELAIARNVEQRAPTEFARPLDHRQVAPLGFLVMVDLSTEVFGVAETGLRFVPWLFGLASVLLFWRVATRFAAGSALVAVVALFSFSPALVWYSSSVKPYGSDVTISLLLVWLALRYLERPEDRRRALVSGSIGAFALLFSFPAVPTAAILTAILAVRWWRFREKLSAVPLLTMGGLWAVGMAVAGFVATSLVAEDVDSWMREIHAGRFPPAHPIEAVAWSFEKLYQVFSHGLVFFPPTNPVLLAMVTIPLVLAAIGIVFLGRKSWTLASILLTPPIAALAAAFAQLLPLLTRLGLHAFWPFLVLAGAGLESLQRRSRGRWRWVPVVLAVVMALPLVAIVLLTARPPYESPRPTRQVVEELASEVRPGDRIYVYTQGRHAVAFYGGRAGIDEWIQGERHYDEPRGYLEEVDALRGSSRAWFFWVNIEGREDPGGIRKYLSTIGEELQRIPEDRFPGAGAVLYDLSDPERLQATSAESFPLPGDEESAE